ncbi:MAG: hypothetical protein ACHQT8_00965 [Chlamydiales bacterium]
MDQNIKPTPPTGPSPHGPQGAPSSPTGAFPSSSGSGYGSDVMSAWGKMFGGQASADELKVIIDFTIKQAVDQMKKQQQHALEAMKKLRREQEENQ